MNLSLVNVLRLERLLNVLRLHLQDAIDEVLIMALTEGNDQETDRFFQGLVASLEDSHSHLSSWDLTPQSEWTGGSSTGPDALPTKLRLPHSLARFARVMRHYSQAEIDEAKQAGLLHGHYGGPAEPVESKSLPERS